MSLDKIIKNLDITKVKAPSGLTLSQELVNAANLLRDCIQEQINRETMGNCISTSDLADIQVDGNTLTITLKIQNSKLHTPDQQLHLHGILAPPSRKGAPLHESKERDLYNWRSTGNCDYINWRSHHAKLSGDLETG